MTHDKQSGAELKACPFCGDLMHNDGEVFGHTDSDLPCIIAKQAWGATERAITEWNTRSLPQAGEGVERALQKVRDVVQAFPKFSDDKEFGYGLNLGDLRAIAALPPAGRVEEMREALNDIAAERNRQIEVEGWTPAHDDEHADEAMAKAAACYALGSTRVYNHRGERASEYLWPWAPEWWKPSANKRRNLIKAAALLVAEIERIDRTALTGKVHP